MGKIIFYIAASLDGCIAKKNGSVDWLKPYENLDYGYKEFYNNIGTLIMGSKTFEKELEFGEWLHGSKKTFVITKRKFDKIPHAGIEFYSGDLKQLVKNIKADSKKDVWLVGGAKPAASFLNEGLVDEIMLFVVPVILKEGIQLFSNIANEPKLKLLESVPYSSGIVKLHYILR